MKDYHSFEVSELVALKRERRSLKHFHLRLAVVTHKETHAASIALHQIEEKKIFKKKM